jgi:hypothetical protein
VIDFTLKLVRVDKFSTVARILDYKSRIVHEIRGYIVLMNDLLYQRLGKAKAAESITLLAAVKNR